MEILAISLGGGYLPYPMEILAISLGGDTSHTPWKY
jgi:hypothetical protein